MRRLLDLLAGEAPSEAGPAQVARELTFASEVPVAGSIVHSWKSCSVLFIRSGILRTFLAEWVTPHSRGSCTQLFPPFGGIGVSANDWRSQRIPRWQLFFF